MIAEFSICPMGKVHFSQVLAEVVLEIKKSGLEYQVGPMGTTVEGREAEVFEMIRRCLEVARQNSERIIMQISIDTKSNREINLEEKAKKISA